MAVAFRVAFSGSFWCTHEHCSRMLALSQRNGFIPALATARRKVVSCMAGEQAATTTPSKL